MPLAVVGAPDMTKDELFAAIGDFLENELGLSKKGKRYWFHRNDLATMWFYIETPRFMDGYFINVGVFYDALRVDGVNKASTFHEWHLGADIGYIVNMKPVLVSKDISNEDLRRIFDTIKGVVVPYVDKWRTVAFLKTRPDIVKSPWQKRLSRETLARFTKSLKGS